MMLLEKLSIMTTLIDVTWLYKKSPGPKDTLAKIKNRIKSKGEEKNKRQGGHDGMSL